MKNISVDPSTPSDSAGEETSSLSSPSDGSLLAMSDLALDRSDEADVSPAPPVSDDPAPPMTPASSSDAYKSVADKRYPSFRDIFKIPLRSSSGRPSVSSSPDDGRGSGSELKKTKAMIKLKNKNKKQKKKKKKKDSGCAGWLDKKKKRNNKRRNEAGLSSSSDTESSISLSDQPPPLVSPQELDEDFTDCALQCSRCARIDEPTGPKGVTYTKLPAGVGDESWLCSDCVQTIRRASSEETTDDVHDSLTEDEEDDPMGLGVPLGRIAPLSHLALDVLIGDVSYPFPPRCL